MVSRLLEASGDQLAFDTSRPYHLQRFLCAPLAAEPSRLQAKHHAVLSPRARLQCVHTPPPPRSPSAVVGDAKPGSTLFILVAGGTREVILDKRQGDCGMTWYVA